MTYPGPSTTGYVYDAFGNRTSMTVDTDETTYAYDDADRLTTLTPPSPASAITYSWDDNGNLTDRGSDEFEWDHEDRMTSATVDSATTTFAYRGDGLRDSRTFNSNTVTFTWDIAAGLPTMIDDGTNRFVWGIGLVSQVTPSGTYYYLSDGLGSTLVMCDSDGDVVNSYTYDVYGTPNQTGSQPNEFDFAGQQTDPTGLQYLRARYYDPATGTFLSRDPLSSGLGWNQHPFGYAGANPVNATDPTGTCILGLPCPDEETKWCISHAHICYQAREVSRSATRIAARYFPSGYGYGQVADDLRDAFRHCIWAALLTINYGRDAASSLLDAHEKDDKENTPAREAMDRFNNDVGQLIGEYHRKWWHATPAALAVPTTRHAGAEQGCYRAAIGGELQHLDGPCGDCRDLPPSGFARRRGSYGPSEVVILRRDEGSRI